ncbi:c-type cytochrome [Tsuneonella sp. HG222]
MTMVSRPALVLALGTLLAVSAACSASSQDEPQAQSAAASRGLMQDRSFSSPDEALYVEKCSMCHREMGMGTVLLQRRGDDQSPVLEDRALPAEYVATVVRKGMGNMPALPPGEVSDEQLARISEYLAKGRGK